MIHRIIGTILMAGIIFGPLSAITCSQGTILPDPVNVKVKSLPSAFHHEEIPVGIGEKSDLELPKWSAFAQNITWAAAAEDQILILKKMQAIYLTDWLKITARI